MKYKKKVVLMIIDGWGIAPPDKFNAIDNADTPNFDRIIRKYHDTSLKTDGESVGLNEGQFGTSEINHLTIGSGRVVFQELPKINAAIESGEFFENEQMLEVVRHAKENGGNLHLIGIVSDGGVHSHIEHLFALLDLAVKEKFKQKVFIHVFSDGRDVPPKSVTKYLERLDEKISKLKKLDVEIATIQGRFYLDRDRDWEKTEQAFELIADLKGYTISNWQAAVNLEYNKNSRDEYFGQYVLPNAEKIKKNDSIFLFHYRTDRQYQLTKRLINETWENVIIGSFVKSSSEFKDLKVAYPKSKVSKTLAEILSTHKKTQLHVTETEKYPHLTYFLNGERESEFPGEAWIMKESNRFVKPYYSFEPSMRNFQIAEEIINSIKNNKHDFIVANFSSPDMVGHTGNYEAAVISAESVDFCLGRIVEEIESRFKDYALIVTADHGNSEIMWDYKNDQPHTQHTFSKVPLVLISDIDHKLSSRESLEDVAPTVLNLMGIDVPGEMTGESLIID